MKQAFERRGPRKPVGPPRLKEIDVQLACVDFMRLDGWRPLRTDPCSDMRRGKGFGELGMADHLFIRYCSETPGDALAEVLWVEFKRPAGFQRGTWRSATKASQDQMAWHRAEKYCGARTAIAGPDFEPSYDGFVAWYRKSGLLRREGL